MSAVLTLHPALAQHILAHLPAFLIRDYLLDLFTGTVKSPARLAEPGVAVPTAPCHIYHGKLLDIGGELYAVTEAAPGVSLNKGQPVSVAPLGVPALHQLASRNSPITLAPGDILNYKGDGALVTTLGRLLLNYAILVAPFADLIPYLNEEWKIGAIEQRYIFDALRTNTITVAQVKTYSRNLHFIGHFTELAVPSFSERSLTVDPAILARRNALLAEHGTAIAAGDTVVMSKIEAELIAMDRASLKGDPSTLFYDQASKSYEVHRKTMYLLGGMVQEFGDKGFSFIGNSLEEGWDVHKLPVINNEIRRGSYNRAKETAKGGEETKFLIRVFQNTRITEDDCKSETYLNVHLTKEMAKDFLYRNIRHNNGLLTLTEENLEQFLGQVVAMRSPMTCQTGEGYCYTCMGELFRTIESEQLTMAAVNVTSTFTTAALKSMHGAKARQISITSLNKFVV